jgi:hypothetical protein
MHFDLLFSLDYTPIYKDYQSLVTLSQDSVRGNSWIQKKAEAFFGIEALRNCLIISLSLSRVILRRSFFEKSHEKRFACSSSEKQQFGGFMGALFSEYPPFMGCGFLGYRSKMVESSSDFLC